MAVTSILLTFALKGIQTRLGIQGKGQSKDRDRDVILGFPNGALKADSLWGRPKITVEGQQMTFYSDLCPLTLQRRGERSFRIGLPINGVFPINS